jgi:hypothetical protein
MRILLTATLLLVWFCGSTQTSYCSDRYAATVKTSSGWSKASMVTGVVAVCFFESSVTILGIGGKQLYGSLVSTNKTLSYTEYTYKDTEEDYFTIRIEKTSGEVTVTITSELFMLLFKNKSNDKASINGYDRT